MRNSMKRSLKAGKIPSKCVIADDFIDKYNLFQSEYSLTLPAINSVWRLFPLAETVTLMIIDEETTDDFY